MIRLVGASLAALGLVLTSCGAVQKLKGEAQDAAGPMTFNGTVKNTAGQALEGATVRFIDLADLTALETLVQAYQIPDGKGGNTTRLRVKFSAVNDFAATAAATTDANGKFSQDVPISVYLVYIFGPGAAPGSNNAYVPAYWGINPDTGELDKDHLIGIDLNTTQTNDSIMLAGGPPPAPTSTPAAQTPVATPSTSPTSVPSEPTTADASRPDDFVAPAVSSFFTNINLTFSEGSIGTKTSTYTVAKATAPSGQNYLSLSATLATAQTDPIYLVLQSGFDSSYSPNCSSVSSQAKTTVYAVQPNGTAIDYKLVPPGPYYKFFLAKTASKDTGKAVSNVTDASQTLIVGTRDCANAIPARPFLATLTWDRAGDLDLYVFKFDASKVTSDSTSVQSALYDEANFMHRAGKSLSLDVDNMIGYGPENNGDASTETSPDSYCYAVLVNYYSGDGNAITGKVDVTWVSTATGKTVVSNYSNPITMKTNGDTVTVGVYGSSANCAKITAK